MDEPLNSASATQSVSVIIAAWNCADFIGRAIASALDQEGVIIEVIVVDDASTDDTLSRVNALAAGDVRLRVIAVETNGGPAHARNVGFLSARHEWIAVLDADDAYGPGRLSRLVTIGRDLAADIVADNFVYYNVAGDRMTAAALKRHPAQQRLDLYAFVSGARPFSGDADFGLLKPVFRTSFLRQSGVNYPTEVRHGEDFEIILRALCSGGVYILDRVTASYIYTDRSSGWSRTAVDYGRQVARSRYLITQKPYVDNARLGRLLTDRATALARLQEYHVKLSQYESVGIWGKLAINLSSPTGWRRIAKAVRNYIRK